MNSTNKYIYENKKIFSLKKKKIPGKFSKRVVGWSLFRLCKYNFFSFLYCIIFIPKVIFEGRYFLYKTFKIRNSCIKKRALIIGNGPSQGYLKKNELDKFVKSGGETFCVNYWHANKNLSSHIPNWLFLSDPSQIDIKKKETVALIQYLKKNPSIKIALPTSFLKPIKKFMLKNDIYCFVDLELSISKNIHPLLPRGYVSLTLYKALAFAINLNYQFIGVIGMDNTYPRNVYMNKKNKLFNFETHAGTKDYLVDFSNNFYNIASYMEELSRMFYSLEYFPNKNIVNLDPYSLTDRFKKVSKKFFFKNHKTSII
jgi:hypothetical protein